MTPVNALAVRYGARSRVEGDDRSLISGGSGVGQQAQSDEVEEKRWNLC